MAEKTTPSIVLATGGAKVVDAPPDHTNAPTPGLGRRKKTINDNGFRCDHCGSWRNWDHHGAQGDTGLHWCNRCTKIIDDPLWLQIRPEPNGDDDLGRSPDIRLRAFLKTMLRRYGWRCCQIRPGRNEADE